MATKIAMPKLSDTMTEGIILKWRYKEGDKVKQGETLVEIESDKADMELESYDTGILRKILVPEGGKAAIGAPIAIIADANEDISALLAGSPIPATIVAEKKATPTVTPVELHAQSASPSQTAAPTNGRLKASPLARRLASENNLRLDSISGSGPQGRIIRRDVEGAMKGSPTKSLPQPMIVPGTTQDVELSLIRKTIAKRMQESKQIAPHFYVTVEIDMEAAIEFREELNKASTSKISFTDIIIKATASTLMKHPQVNASYQGDKMRQYGYAHIAVAVALEEGLVTPVIRNCEQKGIARINLELRDLAERARNRKLKPEEYQGATFTISNLGMFDVDEFVAIINPPEGAILAVGSIRQKPIVRGGGIFIGNTMKVTLSSDHRIIDGAVAARFLQELKKTIENPATLAL
jgi:pyruvate dehydrogenase E2 component (dihydrolipoamide acetyltransferase)